MIQHRYNYYYMHLRSGYGITRQLNTLRRKIKKINRNLTSSAKRKIFFKKKTLVDEQPPTDMSCVVKRICNRGTLQAASV